MNKNEKKEIRNERNHKKMKKTFPHPTPHLPKCLQKDSINSLQEENVQNMSNYPY